MIVFHHILFFKLEILRLVKSCERGSVAIIFALTIIPFMVAAGLAVDLSRAYLTKARLAHALDAAGLAVGSMRTTSSDSAYLETQFNAFFTANYPDEAEGYTHDLTFADNGGIITVTGKATIDTAFMSIIGVDTMTVGSSTEITVETNGLELVMVLDNSGSMSSYSKMTDMKSAALDLIDILFGDETTPDLLKVGLVPFDNTVNIGTGNLAYVNQTAGTFDNWSQMINAPDPTQLASLDNLPGTFAQTTLSDAGVVPYPITLDAPKITSGVSDSINTDFLPNGSPASLNPHLPSLGAPNSGETMIGRRGDDDDDEEDGGGSTTWEGCVMARSYPNDVQDTDTATGGKWEPYYNTENSSDRNKNCPRPITALTNNRATLVSEINAMSSLGATHINFGAVWGWRVISPTAPFTEGAAYSDADWNKAAIILTDGDNTFFNNSSTYYSAYEPGDITVSELDDRLLEVCTGMKAEGIVVYTIAFGTGISWSTESLLSSCATDADHYYESPDADTLSLAFRAIGAELKNLHLSQ